MSLASAPFLNRFFHTLKFGVLAHLGLEFLRREVNRLDVPFEGDRFVDRVTYATPTPAAAIGAAGGLCGALLALLPGF